MMCMDDIRANTPKEPIQMQDGSNRSTSFLSVKEEQGDGWQHTGYHGRVDRVIDHDDPHARTTALLIGDVD